MRLILSAIICAGLIGIYDAQAAPSEMQAAFNRVNECYGINSGAIDLGNILTEELRAKGNQEGVDAMEYSLESLVEMKEVYAEGMEAFRNGVIPNLNLAEGQKYFDDAYSRFSSMSDKDYQTKVNFWYAESTVENDYCIPYFGTLLDEYNRIVDSM